MTWWIYGIIGGASSILYDFIKRKLHKYINNKFVLRLISFNCAFLICYLICFIIYFTLCRYFNWGQ